MKKILVLLFLILPQISFADEFESIRQLAQRRVSGLADELVFEKMDGAANDAFELYTTGKKLHISATSHSAAAMGLNWYLKYYCHRTISHTGDNLAPMSQFPQIEGRLRKDAITKYRYALNYCTPNYSMSFYTWEEWQWELDWMALNGVNLMLTTMGMEAVWQNTMRKTGFTEDEIVKFLPGPAYTAWWLMGNLEGAGGPMPQSQINNRAQLQKQILKRMQELGIEPVLPGFYGIVPSALAKKTNARIIDQGKWFSFQRPGFLMPTDTAFARISDAYYTEIKNLYGPDIKYFSGDPFHEGGVTDGVNLEQAGIGIQKAMQKHFQGATWVLQAWGGNPLKELISGTDKSAMLVQELMGENANNWEQRQAFEGTPFIWCCINNFGEHMGMHGKLQRFADEVYRAKTGQYKNFLSGIGVMAEGIRNNPVAYDLVYELAWHKEHLDVSNWLRNYAYYRYGVDNEHTYKAWQLLMQTAYNSDTSNKESQPENIMCARPADSITYVTTWGRTAKGYNTQLFEEAASSFFDAYPALQNSETYKTDLVEILRQVLANRAEIVYDNIQAAIAQKNQKNFKQQADSFLQLIDMANTISGTIQGFQLSTWQQQAVKNATNDAERKNNLHNALALITYWGGSNKEADPLRDYAFKEWHGLLHGFYKKRWELYFAYIEARMNGSVTAKPDYFTLDRQWVDEHYLTIRDTVIKQDLGQLATLILTK